MLSDDEAHNLTAGGPGVTLPQGRVHDPDRWPTARRHNLPARRTRLIGREQDVIVTDKLASYVPAIKRAVSNAGHRRHKRLNNRAENSHRPVRKRERAMQRFSRRSRRSTSWRRSSAVCNHFRPRRHRLSAGCYRQLMRERFQQWQEIAQLTPTV
jgi:hypothetical protein